jgi:hypothetical protein
VPSLELVELWGARRRNRQMNPCFASIGHELPAEYLRKRDAWLAALAANPRDSPRAYPAP